MIDVVNFNYQSLEYQRTRGHEYQLVTSSFDNKKYYYRIKNSSFTFLERISLLVKVIFKNIFSLGFSNVFADNRSEWRQLVWNKKEIIFVSNIGLKKEWFPESLEDLTLEHVTPYLKGCLEGIQINFSDFRKDRLLKSIPDQTLDTVTIDGKDYQTTCFSLCLNVKSKETLDKFFESDLPKFVNLKWLFLENNNLSELPSSIEKLPEECAICLLNNQFSSTKKEELRERLAPRVLIFGTP